MAAAAREVGCSQATVYSFRKAAGQVRTNVVQLRPKPSTPPRETRARHEMHTHIDKSASLPAISNPALTEGRTIYPTTVHHESRVRMALKDGVNSAKIGGKIRKGKWKGLPVYTLTLEERKTCPTSCRHWRSCYGNNMHLAERLVADDALMWRLERELGWLDLQHRAGYVIRLHVLGDFYSEKYVSFWARMLGDHPKMRVFGYTARWDAKSDPIASLLATVVSKAWDRFAIRFSNAPLAAGATVSIEHPLQAPKGSIICPAQTGKTESCSTCGICWQTTRNVAFLQH